MNFLRHNTASQEILLGPFVDETDGKTAETGLTIDNTDIKIWKSGATSEANKNSGGATHIASGRYYAVLDATDTNTVGMLVVSVQVSGALPVQRQFCVLPSVVYDSLIAGTDELNVDVAKWLGTAAATPTVAGVPEVDVTYWHGELIPSPSVAGYPDVRIDGTIEDFDTLVTKLVRYFRLIARSDAGPSTDHATELSDINSDQGSGGGSFAATDALQAIRDRGDAAWITASPPSAASIADAVWDEDTTGHTTAGTFGAQAKTVLDSRASQTSVDGLNDLDATEVQNAAAAALTAYDPPTKAELDSGLAGLNDLDATEVQTAAAAAITAYDPPTKAELDAGFAGLNDLSAADVNAEVDAALADYDAPTKTELDAGFAALNDLSAADVNAEVDQALADYDGPTKAELDAGLAGLNDLDSTAVQAAAAAALTAYDPPTKAELDSGLAGLNDLDATEVQAAAAAALAAYDPPTKAELDSGLAGLNDLDSTAVQAAAAAAITAYDPPTRTEATADKDAVIAAIPTVEELDTELSANHGAGSWEGGGGGGSGTGSEIVTITVQDAANALAKIQGIPVSAFSAGVRQGTDTSAADGTLQLHLNPGEYPLSAPGYGSWEMSDPAQTITVTEGGENSFTLEMDAIARPDHTDPEKSIAYFTTWDNQGNREGNVPVSAWLKTLPDGTAGNLFDDEPWTVESDDDGDGQFGSNEDGTGLFRGAVYRFRRGDDDDTPVRYWDVTIPDQGSFNLPPIAGSP